MLEILKNGLIKTRFEFDLTGSSSGKNKDKKEVSLSNSQNQDSNVSENDDYLIKKYRLLSAHTIYGKGYPIDYSKKGVLKNAVSLFSDKTLYKNHDADVDNWIGLVKNAKFIEDGNLSGIDAELWIDKKLDDPLQQRLIRGVETGAINRCSVTISFEWEMSHPDMKENTFWDSLGEIVDDQEVRIVANRIEEIYETSLVWWGADHSAKSQSQSHRLSNDTTNKSIANNKGRNASKETLSESEEEIKKMIYEKIKQKLKAILGRELSTDIEIEQAVESLATENVELKAEKENLEGQVVKLKKSEDFEVQMKADLKADVLRLGKIVEGGEIGALASQTIENADFESLQKFQTEYFAKQDKMFEHQCVSCGSKNVERRSSVEALEGSTPDATEKVNYKPLGF